jgi:putative nucleotidyltransferase with HDIG domain
MAAAYRVAQFLRASVAWLRPVQAADLQSCLSPAAVELFRSMPSYDQQHALRVLQTLEEQGHADPDLLAAALLHDVGKSGRQEGRLRLWHRVAVVLMRAFWPGLLLRLGDEAGSGWRRPFYVQLHHAALSAELAQEAGCSPQTVVLIRRHEDQPKAEDEPLLRYLQAADGVN